MIFINRKLEISRVTLAFFVLGLCLFITIICLVTSYTQTQMFEARFFSGFIDTLRYHVSKSQFAYDIVDIRVPSIYSAAKDSISSLRISFDDGLRVYERQFGQSPFPEDSGINNLQLNQDMQVLETKLSMLWSRAEQNILENTDCAWMANYLLQVEELLNALDNAVESCSQHDCQSKSFTEMVLNPLLRFLDSTL